MKLNNQYRSAEDIMTEVAERVPHLVEHMFMDRDWIWLCDVSLKGAEHEHTRQALKDIGFRFAPEGHTMPDGKTVGSWGHSCTAPKRIFKGKRDVVKAVRQRKAQSDEAEILAELKAMGL